MDHQTPFLVALGMLTASAFVVGVTGWIMFARDHAARKLLVAGAGSDGSSSKVPTPASGSSSDPVTASVATSDPHEHHHEVAEES